MPGPEQFGIGHYRRSRELSRQQEKERDDYLGEGPDGELMFHQRVSSRTTFGPDQPNPTREELEGKIRDRLRPGTYVLAEDPVTGELVRVEPARYSVHSRPKPVKPPEPKVIRARDKRSKKST